MEIKSTIEQVGANAKAKGFWDKERNVGEMLMLIVSELGEALDAHREGKRADLKEYKERIIEVGKTFNGSEEAREDFLAHYAMDLFKHRIKDTLEDELADAIIRIFDTCAYLEIDLETHIGLKMKYNTTREKLHGKKY